MAAKKIEFVDHSEGGGAPQKIKTSGSNASTPEKPAIKTAPLLQKSAANTKKVFDVARPGKTAAMPVSKPVIVGHTTSIKQDPMVSTSSNQPETNDKDDESAIAAHRQLTIKPLSVNVTSEGEESSTTIKSSDSEVSEETTSDEEPQSAAPELLVETDEALANTEPEQVSDETGEPEVSNTSETGVDQEAERTATTSIPDETTEQDHTDSDSSHDKPQTEAPDDSGDPDLGAGLKEEAAKKAVDEETAKKAAAVQELIDSKKYFVPTQQIVGKNTAWIWIVLWVVVIFAGAVLAMDAGYIDIGIDLPFDLIKND